MIFKKENGVRSGLLVLLDLVLSPLLLVLGLKDALAIKRIVERKGKHAPEGGQ